MKTISLDSAIALLILVAIFGFIAGSLTCYFSHEQAIKLGYFASPDNIKEMLERFDKYHESRSYGIRN